MPSPGPGCSSPSGQARDNQGSIQGSVLSKSDPTEPELNPANTGHLTPLRRPHNPKVAGSNPDPAMRRSPANVGFFRGTPSLTPPSSLPISYQFCSIFGAAPRLTSKRKCDLDLTRAPSSSLAGTSCPVIEAPALLEGSTLLLLGCQRSVCGAGPPGARRVGLGPGDDARAAVHGAAIGQHQHGQLLLAA